MEPIEYLKIVQRRWTVVVASVLVAMAAAWVVVPEESPGRAQTASHTLYRVTTADEVVGGGVVPGTGSVGLDTLANLAKQGEIPRRAAERLGDGTDAAALLGEVTISGDIEAGTLIVQSIQLDGVRAAAVADAFAAEIVAYFDEQAIAQRERAIVALDERLQRQRGDIAALQQQIDGLTASQELDRLLATTQRDSLLARHGADLATSQQLTASGAASSGLATLQVATPSPVVDGGLRPPTTPVGRMGLGALLGLLLGVGLALGLERVDTRVRTRRGAELAFGLPTVAEIPKLPLAQRGRALISTVAAPASVAAEAFRLLRLALQLMPRHVLQPSAIMDGGLDTAPPEGRDDHLVDGPVKVILVTSAGAGEGKTSTVANLAASFAEGGKLVCALDCDIRHPRLHAYLGGDADQGVTDFLGAAHEDPGAALSALARQTVVPGVWLVPRGSPTNQPGTLMAAAGTLVAAASELADVVLIDAGPLLAVGDPAALAPHVDAVVVVARSGRTTAEEAHRATELLARVQAPVLGVVLVGAPRTSNVGRGYYTPAPAGGPADFLRGLQRRVREERES